MTTLFRLVLQYHAPSLSVSLDSKRISHRIVFAPQLIPETLLHLEEKVNTGMNRDAKMNSNLSSENAAKATDPIELTKKADNKNDREDKNVSDELNRKDDVSPVQDLVQEEKSEEKVSVKSLYNEKQILYAPYYMLFLTCLIYCEEDIKSKIVDRMAAEEFNQLLTVLFENIKDVPALEKLLQEVKNNTPISAIKALDEVTSGGDMKEWEECDKRYMSDIIYPLQTAEVLSMFRRNPPQPYRGIKYMVIDCRSSKSYNFIRLPTAIHLGKRAGYERQKIQKLIDRFDAAKGAHLTLFGTGKSVIAEDHLLQLLAVQFLSRGFKHISYTKGGFLSCIKYISAGEIEYVKDENISKSLGPSPTEQIVNFISDAKVAEKLKGLWNWRSNAGENMDQNFESKKYIPSFALEDSDDESVDIETGVEGSKNEVLLSLKELHNTFGDDIEIFPCTIISTESGLALNCFFVLGRNIVILLKSHPIEVNYSIIIWCRTLRQIVRLRHVKSENTIRLRMKGDASEILDADQMREFESDSIIFEPDLPIVDKICERMQVLDRMSKI